MDYYRRFQAEMHHLALREELPADLAARVDAVSDAATHRIQDELAWWRASERERARAAKEAARPRWRRMLRPGPRDTLPVRPGEPGDDHVQLRDCATYSTRRPGNGWLSCPAPPMSTWPGFVRSKRPARPGLRVKRSAAARS